MFGLQEIFGFRAFLQRNPVAKPVTDRPSSPSTLSSEKDLATTTAIDESSKEASKPSSSIRELAEQVGSFYADEVKEAIFKLYDLGDEGTSALRKTLIEGARTYLFETHFNPKLSEVLRDNKEARSIVLDVLSEAGSEGVRPLILILASFQYYGNKAAAGETISALRKVGEPAVLALKKCLLGEGALPVDERQSRGAALLAASSIGELGIRVLKEALITAGYSSELHSPSLHYTFRSYGEPAVNSLILLLGDTNEDVRKGAKRALSTISEAMTPLVETLKTSLDETVRKGVEEALAGLNLYAVPRLLQEILDGCYIDEVKISALRAFGKIHESYVPRLVEFLRHCLNSEDDNNSLINETERTIANVGRPAVPYVIELLSDPDRKVLDSGELILSRIGEEAIPDLVGALANS